MYFDCGSGSATSVMSIALEPGIHPLQTQEAVGQESGRHEQYQRQRDLRHDQHRAGPRAPAIAGRPAIAGPQHSRGVRAGRLQRGNEPEHERARKCDCDGDGRHGQVKPDLFRAGRAVGQHRHEQRDRPSAGQQPGDSADEAQDQAFGDQLTNEAPASRSECGSDGELALATRGTGEQQAGHICARDEQHDADRTKQDEQRAAHVADDALAEWLEEDPRLPLVSGKRRAMSPAIVPRSADACASVTPGSSRATALKYRTSRASSSSPFTSSGGSGTGHGEAPTPWPQPGN